MKNIKLFALLAMFSIGAFITKTNAQIDVTINPIGALFANLSVGADFAVSENMSVEAQLGFGSDKGGGDLAGYSYKNFPVTVIGKYYFNPNNGTDKFYADVFMRFVKRSYDYDDAFFSAYKQTRFGLGFGIGYKIVGNSGFVFDIGVGAGRAFVDKLKYEDSSGTQTEIDWTELMLNGKLGIGYRFGG
ncbi:MAG TPA: DUF3575 domain-containing protein [Bacteroidetes bacterium]|nr:DUF3575 domain-containing protein [Bacteroidota bacterium]